MNVIFGLIFTCIFKTVLTSVIPCSNDRDCERNQFCGASRCMDCISCSYINKENLLDCPKSLYDCGRCLHGYIEVALNDVTADHIKTCELQIDNTNIVCSNDKHCPDNQFCIQQKCQICFDCKTHNMHSTVSCAKTTNDCGSCLPGYLDWAADEVSQTRSCVGPKASLLSQNTEVQVNVNAMSSIGVILIVVLSILVAILIYRSRKHYSDGVNITNAPPPYTSVSNTPSDDVVEQSIMCTSYKESAEMNNTARVFRLPNYADSSETRNSIAINETSDEIDERLIMCTSYKEAAEVNNTARVFRLPNYADSTSGNINSMPMNEASDGGDEQSIMITHFKEAAEVDNTARVFRLPNDACPTSLNRLHNTPAPNEETLACPWLQNNEEVTIHSGSFNLTRCISAEELASDGITPAFPDQPAAKRQRTSE